MEISPGLSRTKLVARLQDERNPAVLGAYIGHRAWQVRQAAIIGLGNTGSPDAEPYLLQVLAAGRDDLDLTSANSALGRVGSTAALPALTGLIHHRNEDVKCSAIRALGLLGDSSLTPVFVDALADRSWPSKLYAMEAIHRTADERAVGAVSERLRVILSRDRTRVVLPWSEVMYALDYLRRWQTADPKARDAIDWVGSHRLDRLLETERTWFASTFEQAPTGDVAEEGKPTRISEGPRSSRRAPRE